MKTAGRQFNTAYLLYFNIDSERKCLMNIESILSRIPDYQMFYTVDELDEQIRILENEYPSVVKVNEIGTSRNGHTILCMKIGNGKKMHYVLHAPIQMSL